MWQASLNLSLNSQIKVDTVKNTSFEVILPHRMDLNPIGAPRLEDCTWNPGIYYALKSRSIIISRLIKSEGWAPHWVDADSKKCRICVG